MIKNVIFHGGCHRCLTQELMGIDNCANCQYFEADWVKDDLSMFEPTKDDIVRTEIKKRRGLYGDNYG